MPDLASHSLRYNPSMADRATQWSELADAILTAPVDRGELLILAAIASRVVIQAATQAALMGIPDPRDGDYLTPAKFAEARGLTLWSVREALRRKRIKDCDLRRPHPRAVRNVQIRRGAEWRG